METRIISGSGEFTRHAQATAALFKRCFGKPLSESLWRRYYVEPYFGDAIGITLWDGDCLVGFHGLIPHRLSRPGAPDVPYLHSMTSMIEPHHRGIQSYVKFMEEVEAVANEKAVPFVLGFPNASAYPLHVRLWRWVTLCETPFVELAVDEPAQSPRFCAEPIPHLTIPDRYTVPYADSGYLRWRASGRRYHFARIEPDVAVGFKTIPPSTLDVIDAHCQGRVSHVEERLRALARAHACDRILLTRYHAEALALDPRLLRPAGDYVIRLCALTVNEAPPPIHLSLLLSDVY